MNRIIHIQQLTHCWWQHLCSDYPIFDHSMSGDVVRWTHIDFTFSHKFLQSEFFRIWRTRDKSMNSDRRSSRQQRRVINMNASLYRGHPMDRPSSLDTQTTQFVSGRSLLGKRLPRNIKQLIRHTKNLLHHVSDFCLRSVMSALADVREHMFCTWTSWNKMEMCRV